MREQSNCTRDFVFCSWKFFTKKVWRIVEKSWW